MFLISLGLCLCGCCCLLSQEESERQYNQTGERKEEARYEDIFFNRAEELLKRQISNNDRYDERAYLLA